MDGSSLFVSTCTRRELARRRAGGRSWRARYLRWREGGGRSRVAGLLRTGGVDLLVVSTICIGVLAYLVGRGSL